jgi:predicted lipoprotein
MKANIISICLVIAAAAVLWRFPLFHVVSLEETQSARQSESFDAAKFAESFWTDQLLPSLSKAPEASAVFAAYEADPQAARTQFGRKVGVGRTTLLLVRGQGTITQVDKKGVAVALSTDTSQVDVVLHTGLVFGNKVRDSTGLLDASSYANSQQFNKIASALNHIVEERVITRLKADATVGRTINFAGCAEVADDAKELRPLTVVPLEVQIK